MARVEIATQAWGQVVSDLGVPVKDAAVTLNTTVYTAASGAGTITSLKSAADGVLPGFVEEGTHTLTEPDGQARQVEAVSGARLANAKGVIVHGTNAATTRPSVYISVEWQGTVEPTNAVNGDTWVRV